MAKLLPCFRGLSPGAQAAKAADILKADKFAVGLFSIFIFRSSERYLFFVGAERYLLFPA